MDRSLLEQVVQELAALLPGGVVEKVLQTQEGDLVLALRRQRQRQRHLLLLAAGSTMPRMHLLSKRPAPSASPAGFFLLLRKHLTNSRLERLRTVNQDRVVELGFSRMDSALRLVFELTGAAANLVLADREGTVLAVLHPRPSGGGRERPLVPGSRYEPPPLRGRPRAGREVLPLPDAPEDAAAPVNAALERFYEELREEEGAGRLRRRLAASLDRQLRRINRRLAALARDKGTSDRQEEFRRMGGLLLEKGGGLRKGMEQVKLKDHDGALVSIILDPSLAPAGNAERYFQKARRAKRAAGVIAERMAAASAEAERFRSLQKELLSASTRDGLERVRAGLEAAGAAEPDGGRAPRREAVQAAPYRTVDFEGWEILVGRSAAGNDHITMRLARPDDLWLHAEGLPGSHVLVRNPRRVAVPQAVLERAAGLAAFFSRGRSSAKVAVTYAPAGRVRKPKGAKPGMVVLDGRRTIMARPRPA